MCSVLVFSAVFMSAQTQRALARVVPESPSRPDSIQDPSSPQERRDGVTGMVFVWVPSGEFEMGSNSSEAFSEEKPVHRVYVDGFWMGKHEVTQGEWQTIMDSNPSRFKNGSNFPIESVSWEDAQEFIERLKGRAGTAFRLPIIQAAMREILREVLRAARPGSFAAAPGPALQSLFGRPSAIFGGRPRGRAFSVFALRGRGDL
jgi:hypothetical protein